MKNKLIVKKVLLIILMASIQACSKNIETPVNTINQNSNKETILATDPAFVDLNDALLHFDPRYLQVSHNDKRTIDEINKYSKSLFSEWRKDTSNMEIKMKVAKLYNFNSVEELNDYASKIVLNIATIKNKYFPFHTKVSDEEATMFFHARKIYARNKMELIKNNSNKIKTNSMYDDYILNPQAPAFPIFAAIDLEDEADGGGAKCEDACCLTWKSCRITARSNFLNQWWFGNLNLSASGTIIGSTIGSLISTAGAISGAAIGLYLSTLVGSSISMEIYSLNLKACDLDYKACVQRKNGN